MNNLKTTQVGGQPIVLDDLRFIHEATTQAFKGVMSSYGIAAADGIILSGVIRSIVGPDVEYTEGYVSLGGEVLYFPAQTYPIPVTPENEYLTIDVSYAPEGLKVFENTTSKDTYEVRNALMVKSATLPSGGVIWDDLKRFYDVIRTNVDTERVGVVKDFAGNTIPEGYLLCDGSEVSRDTYAALFTAIGTLWGGGDGLTTFNLPNINGRVAVGFDATEADYNTVGNTGGEKEHLLIINEMPNHMHQTGDETFNIGSSVGGTNLLRPEPTGTLINTTDVGGDTPHENRPPYAVFKKIIRI